VKKLLLGALTAAALAVGAAGLGTTAVHADKSPSDGNCGVNGGPFRTFDHNQNHTLVQHLCGTED
jgi:hypothetical protein